jgi:hypothetical protein
MYKKNNGQIHLFDILMEDTFKLDPNNRWIKKSELVPWDLAEQKYMAMFKDDGRPAKNIRMALGALLIQEDKKTSDEETVQEIIENPYLQYFIGLKQFTNEKPFDPSLMVYFRKRLSAEFIAEINEAVCIAEAMPEVENPNDSDESVINNSEELIPNDSNEPIQNDSNKNIQDVTNESTQNEENDDEEPSHGGTLILDCTCTPANIKYPTDTNLLADAIEKTDLMIDTLHEPFVGIEPRPRTYRKKSRKLFVGFIKQKKPGAKKIRKVKGKLLNYLKRNLSIIDGMLEKDNTLLPKQEQQHETIKMLYSQQQEMYDKKVTRVDDRIVSISQPHIRPIVRGKAGTPVEFGAKTLLSVINGYSFINHIDYNAFYEGELLENAIIDYYSRFGMLPSKILVDQAFTSRENRNLCKSLNIKLMGKPLGRPPKGKSHEIDKEDIGKRNEVEGKFGILKTRYGWDRIMARLPETGLTAIAVSVLAMNLNKRVKSLIGFFWEWTESWVYRKIGSCFGAAW